MKQTLIFDLDGTLWSTEKAYAYALNKYIIKNPSMKERCRIENLSLLKGITMDKIMPILFPEEDSVHALQAINECFIYTCEYLKDNYQPKESFLNTIKQIATLYDIYIVSNCPKEYLDIFFDKTHLTPYFKDYVLLGGFTIQDDFDKGKNILSLMEKYQIKKAYLVGDHQCDYQAAKFAKIPFVLLSNNHDCEYDYLINSVEDLLHFEELKQKEEQKKAILKLASFSKSFNYYDARVTYIYNPKQKEYQHLFGFLNLSSNALYNKIVLEKMENIAKEYGASSVVGPINYSTWFDYRLPISEFDWHLLPDIDGQLEDIQMLEQSNYIPLYTYSSTLARFNEQLYQRLQKTKLDKEYQVELIQGFKGFDYAEDIYTISSKCFAEAYLYTDVSLDLFKEIYLPWLVKIPYPLDLLLIKKQEKIVAFGLCYPNYKDQMYVCKTAAILPEYQSRKLVLKLAEYVYLLARQHQLDQILYHFQNEQQHTLTAFWRNCLLRQKRYAIFIKELKKVPK